jgi:hypothetical protein
LKLNKLKKGRGRPPSQETLEKRQVYELLKTIPKHITQEEKDSQDVMLRNLEDAENEVLSEYESYPTIPQSHIYEMASLGDESMVGHEDLILERDIKLRQDAISNRHKGGDESKQIANNRAKLICEKNRILLEKMKPLGHLSKNHVATIIYDQWDRMPLGNRQPGEENMDRRGVEDLGMNASKIPSIRTIERYIDCGSPFSEYRVRQSSSIKK